MGNQDRLWGLIMIDCGERLLNEITPQFFSGERNSCCKKNNTEVLCYDLADINSQKRRIFKRDNNRRYLKRLSSLVALIPPLRT